MNTAEKTSWVVITPHDQGTILLRTGQSVLSRAWQAYVPATAPYAPQNRHDKLFGD
jgi:hypothetical protein